MNENFCQRMDHLQAQITNNKRRKVSNEDNIDRAEFGPASNVPTDEGSQFDPTEDEFNQNIENYEELQELSMEEDNFLSQSIYQNTPIKTEKNINPKIIFNKTEIPNIYTKNASIEPPITKYGKFTVKMSNEITSLFKGLQHSTVTPAKFDVSSQDSQVNNLLNHVNAKYSAIDVPDDCFRIPSTAKPALQSAYRTLSRHQQILKSLILHAEMIKNKFNSESEDEAQELIKIFIQPIEAQITNIHESIRRIRSICLPRYIPTFIKRSIISAPIEPGNLWNISNQIQVKINAARQEFSKKLQTKRNSSYQSSQPRETRPFQTRGRGFDRRPRSQSRGGSSKSRYDNRQDNQRNNEKQ